MREFTSTIKIPFNSRKDAEEALTTLESETIDRDRSSTEFNAKEKSLVITITASDHVALRAAMNTYLRLLGVIYSSLEEAEK